MWKLIVFQRFSFGASEQDVRDSLDTLDKTTDLLSNSVVDDVHISFQTASNVKMIATNLRKTFIRIQAPSGDSREQSRHHTPHGHESGHESDAAIPGQPNTFSYMNATREDTLAGIQAQPMTDYTNVTYMPPPNYNMYMNGSDPNATFDVTANQPLPNTNGFGSADWFALPLDNIFNSSMTVDQGFGGIGPTIGDRDMLELITNENYDQWNGRQNAFQSGYQ